MNSHLLECKNAEHDNKCPLASAEHEYQGESVESSFDSVRSFFPVFVLPSILGFFPSELVLVLPRSLFNIVQNSGLSESVKQQALLFIHLVWRGPKKDDGSRSKKQRGEPVHLHSKALEEQLRSKAKIFELLIPHYIQQSKGYSAGNSSKTYQIKKKWNTGPEIKAKITDPRLIRKYCLSLEKKALRQIEASGQKEVYRKLFQDAQKVFYGLRTLGVFVVVIEEAITAGKDSSSLERLLHELMEGKFRWNLAKNGRLYTGLCGYPERVRAELLICRSPVVEIDISNSHPGLLTIFAHDPKEKEKLQQLTGKGKFYAAFEPFWEIDKPIVQDEGKGCHSFKQSIQKIINGPPRPDLRIYRELQKEFPFLMTTIANYKSKSGNSGFAKELQRREAKLIANVVKACGEIPCFTTYDGITVPAQYQGSVEHYFKEEMNKYLGFVLPTKVKIGVHSRN